MNLFFLRNCTTFNLGFIWSKCFNWPRVQTPTLKSRENLRCGRYHIVPI